MQKGWRSPGTVGVLASGAVAARDNVYCFQANVLGTLAEFVVAAPTREGARLATGAALVEIAQLDCVLSSYRPDSELSRLNLAGEMRVSPDLFAVLSQAEDLQKRSGGAFSARMGAVGARGMLLGRSGASRLLFASGETNKSEMDLSPIEGSRPAF